MRTITLAENKLKPAISLSREECDGLRESASSVTVAPTIGEEGCYDLTPGSEVGVINLGTLAVEIRPKISIDRVLFLISYALNPESWKDIPFGYGQESSLVEAIIPGFVAQVRRAFRRGVLQGYRTEEDALPIVRGRIRFDEQIRRHYGQAPPVEVRYDEFTEDITENRVIKAAIERLGRIRIRSQEARRSLRAFDSLLATVRLVDYDPRRLPEVAYSRLNVHYRPAVELASLILRSTSFELRHGEVRASTFLVDMNRVFEDFVVVGLREALRLSPRTFPQGSRGKHLYLDKRNAVRLEPDLSWWDGSTCTFVGDAKYKRVNVEGIKHPDLYQILAYTVAADLPAGLLIYAAGEGDPATHEVVHLGRELHVITLDLSGTVDQVLAQVADVADQVRALRREAIVDRAA